MIYIKYFAGHESVRHCLGYVRRPGLYVLCHLLDISSHVVSQSQATIRPFGKDTGVKIAFKEKTFVEENVVVDCKVTRNYFFLVLLSYWSYQAINNDL